MKTILALACCLLVTTAEAQYYPRDRYATQRPVPYPRPCPNCGQIIHPPPPPKCPYCGHPLPPQKPR
jgi:hypothetical protein